MDKIALARLNQLRKDRNETYKMLEEAVGISDSTLSAWYSGKAEPSTYGLEKLAAHYNMTVAELYASVPLSTVPQEKQQDMDIILRIIDECNADKSFQAHHCQTIVDHQKELRQLEATNHARLMQQELAHHEKVVDYLKKQVSRFRLTTIIFCALFVCGIIYTTFISAVDLPQLGAGGSVVQNGGVALGFLRLITIPLLILLLAAICWLLISNRKLRTPSTKEDAHP